MAVPILMSPVGCVDAASSSGTASNSASATSSTNVTATTTAPPASVVSQDGVFWISLSSDERYLLPKLDQLLLELEYDNIDIRSFRISNTQDISNLTTNRPLLKLKQIFRALARKQEEEEPSSSSSSGQHHRRQRRELFIKMSLQTESFQDLLNSALSTGAFSRLTVKGDYWTVAMEAKTMECIAHAMSVQKNSLEQLHLVGMFMGTEATSILSEQLRQKGGRTTILQSLQFCRITFEDAVPLLKAFEGSEDDGKDHNLPVLGLSVVECNFTDEHLVPLMQALTYRLHDDDSGSTSCSLMRLSLAGNVAGEGTVRAVAEYLEHPNCRLQHLNMSRQSTHNMAELLVDVKSPFRAALFRNQTLRSLGLANLALEEKHVADLLDNAVGKMLPTTLNELNLADNLVTTLSRVWIVDSRDEETCRHDNLRRLDLTGNPFWRQAQGSANQTECPERDTLTKMATHYPHLRYLGTEVERGALIESTAGYFGSSRFWTILQHTLDMNHAGTHFFDDKDSVNKCLPVSLALVPIVLERANAKLVGGIDEGLDEWTVDERTTASGRGIFEPETNEGCCSFASFKPSVNKRSASALYGLVQGLVQSQFGGRL